MASIMSSLRCVFTFGSYCNNPDIPIGNKKENTFTLHGIPKGSEPHQLAVTPKDIFHTSLDPINNVYKTYATWKINDGCQNQSGNHIPMPWYVEFATFKLPSIYGYPILINSSAEVYLTTFQAQQKAMSQGGYLPISAISYMTIGTSSWLPCAFRQRLTSDHSMQNKGDSIWSGLGMLGLEAVTGYLTSIRDKMDPSQIKFEIVTQASQADGTETAVLFLSNFGSKQASELGQFQKFTSGKQGFFITTELGRLFFSNRGATESPTAQKTELHQTLHHT
jgi:hypothetical protein